MAEAIPPNSSEVMPLTLQRLQAEIEDLQSRLGKAERELADLEQWKTQFSTHTHLYHPPNFGFDRYESFLDFPDGHKNLLVHFTSPDGPPSQPSPTGPPNF
jgi:hypothetical protein